MINKLLSIMVMILPERMTNWIFAKLLPKRYFHRWSAHCFSFSREDKISGHVSAINKKNKGKKIDWNNV